MPDDSDPRRDALHAFLQQQGPPRDGDEAPNGSAILTGWVLVTEWMDEDGTRWISKGYAASKAAWEADGMLHEGLYGRWTRD